MRRWGGQWDPDQREAMRRLYVDESKTAGEVAKALGLASRNVVLRQAQKHGWAHLEAAPKPPKPVKEPRARRPVPARSPPPPTVAAKPQGNVPFLSRKYDQCAWIVVEGEQALCCGRTVVEGSSWCPAHHKRAFQPKKARAK